jgi:hypothetical protein
MLRPSKYPDFAVIDREAFLQSPNTLAEHSVIKSANLSEQVGARNSMGLHRTASGSKAPGGRAKWA